MLCLHRTSVSPTILLGEIAKSCVDLFLFQNTYSKRKMAQSSDTLAQKLHSLNPIISELLKNSGSPGLSIGVLHHGEVVHTGHYGRRDISIPGSPNDETIYHIISLTKLLTAATMGLLVDKGHIHWDTRIHEILPVFKNRNDDIGQEATLIDVLSNRTGLSPAHAYYAQLNDEIVLPKTEMTRMSCQIQAVKPFREDFVYSSWNYALVTDVIEKAAGKTFGAFVKEAILDPLDMQRTTSTITPYVFQCITRADSYICSWRPRSHRCQHCISTCSIQRWNSP